MIKVGSTIEVFRCLGDGEVCDGVVDETYSFRRELLNVEVLKVPVHEGYEEGGSFVSYKDKVYLECEGSLEFEVLREFDVDGLLVVEAPNLQDTTKNVLVYVYKSGTCTCDLVSYRKDVPIEAKDNKLYIGDDLVIDGEFIRETVLEEFDFDIND